MLLDKFGVQPTGDSFVYLGSRDEGDVIYWAIDVSGEGSLVPELGNEQFCFVELRTLMVATDWADAQAMGELAVAGHVSSWSCLMADFFMSVVYWPAFYVRLVAS